MDYRGQTTGFRVADDQKTFTIIRKVGLVWEPWGGKLGITELKNADAHHTQQSYSAVGLVWALLSHENPEARNKIREISN
jgi:hypothetical protein